MDVCESCVWVYGLQYNRPNVEPTLMVTRLETFDTGYIEEAQRNLGFEERKNSAVERNEEEEAEEEEKKVQGIWT